MNYIIGCGGAGSWLTPLMCKLVGGGQLCLVDGDKLEEKNLDRQLFLMSDMGKNKAVALSKRYIVAWVRDEWFGYGTIPGLTMKDWLLVCVDNDPARLAALEEADRTGCQVIVCANETNSSEAYYYRTEWKDSPRDPRVYYPNLLTNHDGDPRAQAVGCTGAAQESNRQLVTANFMSASLLGHLYVLWALNAPKFDADTRESLPYKLVANMTSLETHKPQRQERTEQHE